MSYYVIYIISIFNIYGAHHARLPLRTRPAGHLPEHVDVMQLAWLIVPFAFSAVIFALILHHMRNTGKEIEAFPAQEPEVYKMMNEDLRERVGLIGQE